jgi:hypothetical protein
MNKSLYRKMDILDGGQTVIATGLESAQGISITMTATPEINGGYTSSSQGFEQGEPATIDYFGQLVTDESIIGYLNSSLTFDGVTRSLYRPFGMVYDR